MCSAGTVAEQVLSAVHPKLTTLSNLRFLVLDSVSLIDDQVTPVKPLKHRLLSDAHFI